MEYYHADEALAGLCERVLVHGDEVGTRQGERAKELTHQTFTVMNPLSRVLRNPARKASVAAQIAETAWVLAGRNDVEWLGHYLPRAKDFSDDGKTWRGAYGPRLRCWGENGHRSKTPFFTVGPLARGLHGTDQLDRVVKLLQSDAMTRRATISLYDPEFDTGVSSKDIPCNNWITFTNRLGRLDMSVAIRSNDLIWGWSGINQFEWSVLLEVVAHMVGVDPGTITYHVASQHIYEKHWKRAKSIFEAFTYGQLAEGSPDPRFKGPRDVYALDTYLRRFFQLEARIRDGVGDWVSEISDFPEPMLRSWLCVLAYHWTGDVTHLEPIEGTFLANAALRETTPKVVEETTPKVVEEKPLAQAEFYRHVSELHARKHEAYGDSWKRRGELLGIMANIARKVDRLGVSNEDETDLDTAVDLLAYLIKYRVWLGGTREPAMELAEFNNTLREYCSWPFVPRRSRERSIEMIREDFEALEVAVGAHGEVPDTDERSGLVVQLLQWSFDYALKLHLDYDEYRGADVD